jgi:hypothetical protein
MLSRDQLALVHVAKRSLGLTDEAYRDILHVETGVESSKDLDRKGLDRLLSRFADMGFRQGHLDGRPRGKPKARPVPDANDLPTPGQQGMLRHLWEDVGWPLGERRTEFCQRMCGGHPWPQTRAEANVLIEGLKAMVKRGYSERVERKPRRRAAPKPGSGG